MIADTGGTVSLACPVEMQMGHGIPPIQSCLDRGLRPSLSVDVETTMSGDLFAQMRSVLTLQRSLVNERRLKGEDEPAGGADQPRRASSLRQSTARGPTAWITRSAR